MPKRTIIFDSQILNSVQMCAARTNFYFEMNLRPPQVAIPLETGDLLHQMFEKYYLLHKELGVDLVYSQETFDKVLKGIISFAEEYSSEKLGISAEETDEVIKHFSENIKFWKNDGMVVKEIEQAFIVPILESPEEDEIDIFYSGKIDLICTIPEHGEVWIDHKSERRKSDADPLSNQFTGYSFSTKIRKGIINKVGFQTTKKPEERFRRLPLLYSVEQLERWKLNTIYWGRQYAFYMEYGEWPENRTSCDKFGGCLFQRICAAATDEAREWLIKSAYIVDEKGWDPTRHLKEKES